MSAPVVRKTRRWPLALFLLFVLAYNLFRVALFAMTQTEAIRPDRPLDPTVNSVVVFSELAIGLAGLLAIPGLVWPRSWGFWLTAAINVYAIAFDVVAAVAVQASAAGGVVPPVIILVLLLVPFRGRFLKGFTPPRMAPGMPS